MENMAVTLLEVGTRTATPAASAYKGVMKTDAGNLFDIVNREAAGVAVVLSVLTAPGGGGSLTVRINGVDRLTANYNLTNGTTYPSTWNILESDPITAPGTYTFRVYPTAVTEVSGLVKNDFVPRIFQVPVTHSDATSSWLYGLSYQTVTG